VGTGGDCAIIWAVYSGEVGGEVGTRYRMCLGGWEVWVHVGSPHDSKKMFNGRDSPIRINGEPESQRPDKRNSTVVAVRTTGR